MNSVYIIVAILAGIMFAVQPALNKNVGRYLNHPIQASFVSFLVGTLFLLVINFALGLKFPSTEKLTTIPWWLWLAGGSIGAFVVTVALIIQPKIGAGVWISCFIFGQLVMSERPRLKKTGLPLTSSERPRLKKTGLPLTSSILLDNYGWLGLTVHPINPMRSLGAFLLAIGAILVAFY